MMPDASRVVWWTLIVVLIEQVHTNDVTGCGGQLNQQSGVITSPKYPDNYPDNKRCNWTITADGNEIIDLRFSRLDLDGTVSDLQWVGSTCPDYVRVYDGDSINSPLIVTMCRIKTQSELANIIIRSTKNKLHIVFVSDYQGQRPGFVASYWKHECPGFTYGSESCNRTCECNMENTASCNNTNGECICKKGWTSSDCSQDINECLNPRVESCPYNYTECVNTIGSFECVCKAGLTKNASGECEVDPAAVCTGGNSCSHLCVNIMTQSQTAQAQCYCPDNMKLVGSSCQVCSNVTFGKNCRLTCPCSSSGTESCDSATGGCICSKGWKNPNCSEDINECRELRGSVCPSSDEQCVNTLGGYQCVCKSGNARLPSGSCQGCNGTFTNSSGIIHSPNYPDNTYQNDDVRCNWTIITRNQGATILFNLTEAYVGYKPDNFRDRCNAGSLEVYDGRNSSATLLARYCGRYMNSRSVRSSGDSMFLVYYGRRNAEKLFKGIYSTGDYQVFASKMTDPSGNITSPGYPLGYTSNVYATWTITVNNSNVVTLSFSDYSLGECGSDYVEIYDGSHAGAERIVQFCGRHVPRNISSTGNSMHVIFSSKGSTSERGFNGYYITDACRCSQYYTASCNSPTGPCVCKSGYTGSSCDNDIDECQSNSCPDHSTCINSWGSYYCYCWNGTQVNSNASCEDWKQTLSGQYGYIQSQRYPNSYPNYMNYSWTIIGKPNTVISFRFSDFDVMGTHKCESDVVEVYDVSSRNKLIGQYCGKNIPALLRTTGNKMRINFRTGRYRYNGYNKGFNGTYYSHNCPLFTYGEETCSSPCSCAYETTRFCDNTNGVCFCKPGWIGRGCSQDLDECRIPEVCPRNSDCTNVPGTYTCECLTGYVMDSTTSECKESYRCSAAMRQTCSHLCDVDQVTQEEKCFCPNGLVLLRDNVTCVVSLYPNGIEAADTVVFGTNQFNSPIQFSYLVPVGHTLYSRANVLYNGVITFGDKKITGFPDLQTAQSSKHSLIAPFWTEQKDSGIGKVFYHVYDKCDTKRQSPKEEEVIARATQDITKFYNLPGFEVKVVLVATWKAVQPKGCADNFTNTFQAVFVSGHHSETTKFYLKDEETSYVIFIYNDGDGICRSGQPFQIGIASDSGFRSLDINLQEQKLTQINQGYRGMKTYKFGEVNSESLMCQRYLCKHADLISNQHFQSEIQELYECPCSLDRLGLQWQLIKEERETKCYALSAVAKERLLRNNQRNRLCCYSWTPPKSDNWEDRQKSWLAGSFVSTGHILISDPWSDSSFGNSHALQDAKENMQARALCCEKSSHELCNKFNNIFGGDLPCTKHPTFVPASALGDPYVMTLDRHSYPMNGWGEYVLMDVPSDNFTLQARTQRVEFNGTFSNGTVFTAFAAQEGDYARFQVQLDTTNTKMIILINGMDYTNKFYKNSTFSLSNDKISVTKQNENKRAVVAASFPCGVSIKVHVGVKSLEIDLEVDNSLKNKTRGLLGNFNGDPNDDYLLPNGTVLSPNITERQIFEHFAKAFLITANTSVFMYDKGESTADYQHPEYVPMFLDETNPHQLAEAKRLCGSNNTACILDYIATGNKDFATNTKEGEEIVVFKIQSLDNNPPTIQLTTNVDSSNRWLVYEGKQNSATVEATDEDNDKVIYELFGNITGVIIDQNGVITFTPDLQKPIRMQVRAKDSKGAYSSILTIAIGVCPLCNNHGNCNANVTAAEFLDGQYQILKCNCFPAYAGEKCELELDACEFSPCSVGQDCADLTATEQGNNSVGYRCGPCPAGTIDVAGSCEDINECIGNTVCDQECLDTYRSYQCSCRPGFRLDQSDNRTCNDINECVERTAACQQECRNTAGSYSCACRDGYLLSSDGTTCIIDPSISSLCKQCEQVCSISNGQVTCSCNLGYKIDENNSTKCNDIDECINSPCAQNCTNTRGKFECSCYSGYKLDIDGVSCLDIDECLEYTNRCDLNLEDCYNNVGNYSCRCKEGFRQNEVTGVCEDINECESHSGCEHICENGPGSYRCVCHQGYRLAADRHSCEKYKEVCNLNCSHGCSLDDSGTPFCICPRGYRQVGPNSCEDINECARADENPCDHKDRCNNTEGSYICSCEPGYRLENDGKSCVACSSGTWGVECNNSCSCGKEAISCDPVMGCQCKPGCTGDRCTEVIDRCASGEVTCEPNEECVISGCSSVCQCRKGFVWGRGQCEDENECQLTGHHNCDQVCTNTVGSFVCSCYPGYYFNSSTNTCQDENECQITGKHNCDQNCTNTVGSFICSCYPGYYYNSSTNTCQDLNECEQKNPCSQVCVNTNGSYQCACQTGQYLQADGVSCDACPNGCPLICNCVEHNTDNCDRNVNKCNCKKGWTSNDCSVDVDECLQNPCPNQKRCNNVNGSFECVCWNGLQVASDGTCKDCNRTLTDRTGYLMSSNYPQGYQSNSYCSWTIMINDSDASIVLSFLDYDVEGCYFDYVKIYNGGSNQAPLLDTVCDNWQKPLTSVGNSLHIVFTSDFSLNKKGFLASYTSHVPCTSKTCSHSCKVISSNPRLEKCQCPEWMKLDQTNDSTCVNMNACNTTITEPRGYIVSSNYPERYPFNFNCQWTIQASQNSFVKLSFTDFNLETSFQCSNDHLTIHDGSSESAPLLGHFCGRNLPADITSSGNILYIKFKTDGYFNYRGFKGKYTIHARK